jgi:hypothetical protein
MQIVHLKLFWDWAKGPGARAKNVVQIVSNMPYLSFQLSDWAEIWGKFFTLVNLMGSVFSYRSCEIERSAYYKMEKAEYQMTGMADKAYSGSIK